MTRTDSPLLFLSEPPTRSQAAQRVTSFDFAFLIASLVLVIGGCLWLLDVGAARNSGGGSFTLQWLTETALGVPALLGSFSKYVLLLLGSVLNSALIVLLVHSLRMVDRRVTTRRPHRSPLLPARRPGMENVRRPAKIFAVADSSAFLLPPVFR